VFQLLADGKKLPLALARFFAWGVGTGLGEIRGTLPVARRQKFLGFGRLSLLAPNAEVSVVPRKRHSTPESFTALAALFAGWMKRDARFPRLEDD
jgi:hypothetical protein